MPRANLLVIDDEPNILTSLRRALELEDFAVEVAGSGKVGLGKLAERDIDLVLLDVMMPEMSGIEVLEQIGDQVPRDQRGHDERQRDHRDRSLGDQARRL